MIPMRCAHGRIILGCPHGDCAEQNAYLAHQQAQIDAWHQRQQNEARAIARSLLGLAPEQENDR